MTAQNRTVLKAAFETGDIPTGADYANLIDSMVAIADTSAQTMLSTLTVPTLNASVKVSAAALNVPAIASVNSLVLTSAIAIVTAMTTATASAGTGSTVPLTVAKYAKVAVSGVTYNIALYESV